MEQQMDIKLLHVPFNGGGARIIYLHEIVPSNEYPVALDPFTKVLEDRFKYFLDLRPFADVSNLQNRLLHELDFSNPAAPGKWHGTYYGYTGISPWDGAGKELLKNPHFKEHAKVYGEVFVFRLRAPRNANRRGWAYFEGYGGSNRRKFQCWGRCQTIPR